MTTDKLVDIYSKAEVVICYENYLTLLNWFWQLSYFNNLFLTALKFFRDNEAWWKKNKKLMLITDTWVVFTQNGCINFLVKVTNKLSEHIISMCIIDL